MTADLFPATPQPPDPLTAARSRWKEAWNAVHGPDAQRPAPEDKVFTLRLCESEVAKLEAAELKRRKG